MRGWMGVPMRGDTSVLAMTERTMGIATPCCGMARNDRKDGGRNKYFVNIWGNTRHLKKIMYNTIYVK